MISFPFCHWKWYSYYSLCKNKTHSSIYLPDKRIDFINFMYYLIFFLANFSEQFLKSSTIPFALKQILNFWGAKILAFSNTFPMCFSFTKFSVSFPSKCSFFYIQFSFSCIMLNIGQTHTLIILQCSDRKVLKYVFVFQHYTWTC